MIVTNHIRIRYELYTIVTKHYTYLVCMLDFTMCVLTGPPGDVNNIILTPVETETCTLMVQWDKVTGEQHGSVNYTLTVFNLEEMVHNHTTSDTNCTVTGLNSGDTDYTINVTATNNCGNGRSGMTHMKASNGKLISCTYVAINSYNYYKCVCACACACACTPCTQV